MKTLAMTAKQLISGIKFLKTLAGTAKAAKFLDEMLGNWQGHLKQLILGMGCLKTLARTAETINCKYKVLENAGRDS